ncbi:hypothetical protein ACHAWF_004498, partial [Thalassiosira exigua]
MLATGCAIAIASVWPRNESRLWKGIAGVENFQKCPQKPEVKHDAAPPGRRSKYTVGLKTPKNARRKLKSSKTPRLHSTSRDIPKEQKRPHAKEVLARRGTGGARAHVQQRQQSAVNRDTVKI